MRKIFLIISLLTLTAFTTNAQVAKWLIKPEYDQIELVNGDLFKGYTDGQTIVWNQKGREVARIEAEVEITPFCEGMGLLLAKGTSQIVGIISEQGNIIDLREQKYTVADDFPYFSSDFLLVRKATKYVFLDKNGEHNFGIFEKAYPVCDGVACVATSPKPGEILWNYLYTEDGSMLFDIKDTPTFCASFKDGRAVVAFDKKFFFVDKVKALTPMHTDNNLQNKKSLVVADSKELIINKSARGYSLDARNARFEFDKYMRPTAINFSGQESIEYDYPAPPMPFVDSDFEKYSSHDGKYGLTYDDELLLPPQFDFVPVMVDDNAVVKTNGQYGVVTLDKNAKISFKVNNNEYISFVHQYHMAKLMVSLPSFIKCSSAIVSSKSDFCEIQSETRIERENIEANVVGYDCRLTIDKNLTDTLTLRDYYFSVLYEGLRSIDFKVSVEEWFVKYYKVELSKNEFEIQKGDSIQIEFDVLKSDSRMDESVYFKKVELNTSGLYNTPVLNKISESHYSFYLTDPGNDQATFTVKITETGCPSVEYPFNVNFIRPENSKDKTIVNVKSATQNTSGNADSGDAWQFSIAN